MNDAEGPELVEGLEPFFRKEFITLIFKLLFKRCKKGEKRKIRPVAKAEILRLKSYSEEITINPVSLPNFDERASKSISMSALNLGL